MDLTVPHPNLDKEATRIKAVYARRDQTGRSKLYRWDRPDAAYAAHRQRLAWIRAFRFAGFQDLAQLQILDVGCGAGAWLRQLLEWGARPERLYGVDLLPDRIARARELSPPALNLQVGHSGGLDYPSGFFDLCTAATVFSSILDPEARRQLAQEMLRVTKEKGWLAVFDFAVSHPANPDTIGIGKAEIKRLFAEAKLVKTFHLLFPLPLLRRLPGWALDWLHGWERLLFLGCTHRLYLLQKVS